MRLRALDSDMSATLSQQVRDLLLHPRHFAALYLYVLHQQCASRDEPVPRGSRSKTGQPNSCSKLWIRRFSKEVVKYTFSTARRIDPPRHTDSINSKFHSQLISLPFSQYAAIFASLLC